MNPPEITVVTPTFNRAHTLQRAFDSLLNQSFQDFKWIIMDDGSTDNTNQLVQNFKEKSPFEIDYYYNLNKHKFHTVFEGIEKVKSPYFIILDSDDSYPKDAFQILIDEIEKIPNPEKYIAVMGLSGDDDGKVVGDEYPNGGFDGTIFEMRYQHKVKGDKNGLFLTKSYQKELSLFDYSQIPSGIYIPQSVFFNIYDAKGLKTRFINKIIRNYHKDENDAASVSNTRWSGKNRIGLMMGHLSFLNNYGKQLGKYPKALIRNLVGYHLYSYANGKSMKEINQDLNYFKTISTLMAPFSFLYYKIKL
jgi:glycosyltransferase involved in cell wall biosynthesis